MAELGQSLLDFGKAVKLLRTCKGEPTGKAFSDLGTKSELLSIKLQKVAQQVLMNFEEPLKDYVRYFKTCLDIKLYPLAFVLCIQGDNSITRHCIQTTFDKLMLTRSDKVGEAEKEYIEEATIRFERMVKRTKRIVRFSMLNYTFS
ncbi:sorting nexin 1-like [Brassica napus]|uniref:sorting nexin 1-like n=1 Tax=Brassica napus TaxID=3708 RepID=UPI0020788DCD|nr:sorting nexin 1-like [Brassica napus]